MKSSFVEGFDDVSEWSGDLGTLQRLFVGIGCEVDYRDVKTMAYLLRRIEAVHHAFEFDVHQH